MSELSKQLKEEFKNSPAHLAKLHKETRQVKEIFRKWPIEKFAEYLEQSSRNPEVEYDGTHFQLKPAYEVWNKESLRKFILENCELGVKDDEKLQFCYWGINDDINSLIEEFWIRVVEVPESTRSAVKEMSRVLFPRDQNNHEVEFTKEELPENCQNYLADLWEKDLGNRTEVKWEQILLEADLLKDQEKEILSTRQVKNQAKKNAQFDDKGRLIQEGEMVSGKRKRPRKLKW